MIDRDLQAHDILLASDDLTGGLRRVSLSIPAIHCGGCIRKIEDHFAGLTHVINARVNLTLKRITVEWYPSKETRTLIEELGLLGYEAMIFHNQTIDDGTESRALMRSLAVAGFSAGNVMMLSVAVWAGAVDSIRDLFHSVSLVIALPAFFYAGLPFYGSAWRAVSKRQTNMDVPISVGLALTFGMSCYDTIQGGGHAYFDAATMLIFFLLIGRVLDFRMRDKARSAVQSLAKLMPASTTRLEKDGTTKIVDVSDITPGMSLKIRAGERFPVNGHVTDGISDIDMSIVTGESKPVRMEKGGVIAAGSLNLTGLLIVEASSTAETSFLAEMIQLLSKTETGRARYRMLADRMARLYSPFVHFCAFVAFIVWMMLDAGLYQSLTVSVSVLIITCPCALGLAVPMVQVVALKRLFEKAIIARSGAALERLSDIDYVVFDKTGTLTKGVSRLLNSTQHSADLQEFAKSLAEQSNHPYSHAIAIAYEDVPLLQLDEVIEFPGEGIQALHQGRLYRLGRRSWALTNDELDLGGTVLSCDGALECVFEFEDQQREDALLLVDELRALGIGVEIVSGDVRDRVELLAKSLNIETFFAQMTPRQKVERLEHLAAAGRRTLMIGDGLNDVAALKAAYVSVAPSNAVDIGRAEADFALLSETLITIAFAHRLATGAHRLIRQNFAFAILYNLIAVPFAFAGYVTPLFAAIAMSASSIIVVLNALRLGPKSVGSSIPFVPEENDLIGRQLIRAKSRGTV